MYYNSYNENVEQTKRVEVITCDQYTVIGKLTPSYFIQYIQLRLS